MLLNNWIVNFFNWIDRKSWKDQTYLFIQNKSNEQFPKKNLDVQGVKSNPLDSSDSFIRSIIRHTISSNPRLRMSKDSIWQKKIQN